MHFNSRYRYSSALATPLCLMASCYLSLSLRAIVPTGKIVPSWKFQSIPILFATTFNGINRWKLKGTIVVISFSPNSETVWMGSSQAPKHSRLWYYRISSKRVYSATQNYSTEAVSIISTVRENRYPPVLSSDVAQWQNNTSYITPFKANTLILYNQWISGHQPEKCFVLISSIIWERKIMRFRHCYNGVFHLFDCYCLCTWPNLIPR